MILILYKHSTEIKIILVKVSIDDWKKKYIYIIMYNKEFFFSVFFLHHLWVLCMHISTLCMLTSMLILQQVWYNYLQIIIVYVSDSAVITDVRG